MRQLDQETPLGETTITVTDYTHQIRNIPLEDRLMRAFYAEQPENLCCLSK
jgi:hypothetical protein